ncbi:hypothetical protein QZH45_17925 [Pseudomonas corrugata]|uniref:hypothetical protein n=1 Tax=Pseudomonas corrugata TaxID=47879 RepID=UPI0011C34A4E|nr:hypothetical protein [Pseudomonas corrugata]MDU9024860.1 hypothetical protein [Pseudomonas corrugata]MDU9034675.1 hypothetical protein [Pseudomonas corrugata]
MEKRFPPRYSPDSQPLAGLESPWFPGWTLFVEDYDAGIPARLVEGGLLCIVDPWTQMEVGDVFHLYWKDKKRGRIYFRKSKSDVGHSCTGLHRLAPLPTTAPESAGLCAWGAGSIVCRSLTNQRSGLATRIILGT